MRLYNSFFVLLVLGFYQCFSQTYDKLVKAPVSPNASALGEYGNTPVSLASGTPSIEIPLYEIKGKKLSVPISLSYRASGVKVEDIASNVGINWVINAGGVISRSVMGLPDIGLHQGAMFPRRAEGLPLSENNYDCRHVKSVILSSGNIDPQPDLYYYNFLNYSGKFVFDNDGTSVAAPDVNFKVHSSWPDGQITITDGVGNKYYFHWMEATHYLNSEDLTATAWYLTKVESHDSAEMIEFEYEAEFYNYPRTLQETIFFNGANAIRKLIFETWSEDAVYTEVFNGARLRRIKTNFGYTVEFPPGIVRREFEGKTIGGMQVFYGNELITGFNFEQSYLETTKPANSLSPAQISTTNFRLYLEGVTLLDRSLSEIGSYEFTYYGRLNEKDLLPCRVSYAQDHWGYYNGEDNNTTLRPTIKKFPLSNEVLSGANRLSSFPEMQYGSLESIKYPTGGKTVFIYEAHEFVEQSSTEGVFFGETVGGLRIREVNDYDKGVLVRMKKYEYENPFLSGWPKYKVVSGTYYNEGKYHKFLHPGCFCGDPVDCNWYDEVYKSTPVNSLGTTNGYHITYGKVREIEPGNGYKEYEYSGTNDGAADSYWNGNSDAFLTRAVTHESSDSDLLKCSIVETWQDTGWPFVPITDFSWKRGVLKSEKVFREGELEPYRSVKNVYQFVEFPQINGVAYESVGFVGCKPMDDAPISLPHIWAEVYYGDYAIKLGHANIISQTIIEDGVNRTIQTEYLGNLVTNIKETVNGQIHETINLYPHSPEFDSNPELGSDVLREADILEPILRTIKKVDGVEVFRLENEYAIINGTPQLVKRTISPQGMVSGKQEIFITYDEYLNISSVRKESDKCDSYLWDYDNQLLVAYTDNSTINDIAYSSFESENTGNWIYTTSQNPDLTDAVTGQFSHDISHQIQKNDLSPAMTYKLSYWNKGGEINKSVVPVPGTEKSYLNTDTGWSYWEGVITGTTSLTLSKGSGDKVLIDELRLHPAEAQMNTYTYHPGIGITSMTDANNVITYYDYDPFNRLQLVKDNNKNILKVFKYQYRGDE